VHIVVSSGLVGRCNSYYRIQDVSADKLVSATHVSVQGHKGGQNRSWTSIFVPERHLLKCLGKSLVYFKILLGDASYTLNPALFGSSFVWQIQLSLLNISLFKVTQKIFQLRLM
jgi:hypothetical protein